jgi:hypothetical protein
MPITFFSLHPSPEYKVKVGRIFLSSAPVTKRASNMPVNGRRQPLNVRKIAYPHCKAPYPVEELHTLSEFH